MGSVMSSVEVHSQEPIVGVTPVTVSVVIAAYNAERTIVDCVSSILCQTVADLEIVVCDDASTDDTVALILAFEDERIRLVLNEANQGAGSARDRAIAASRGRWITVCDADDMFAPDRIESLLEVAKDHEERIVFDDLMICHDSEGKLVPWRRQFGGGKFGAGKEAVRVSAGAWLTAGNRRIQPFFSRDMLAVTQAHHGFYPYAEDIHFLLKLLVRAKGLLYVPKVGYLYRITPGSATANPGRYRYMRQVFEDCLGDFRQHAEMYALLQSEIAKARKLERYPCLIRAIKQGGLREAGLLSVQTPWLVWHLFVNVVKSLPYYLHRASHGGASRNARLARKRG